METITDFETEFADELAEIPDEHFDTARFVPGIGPLDADVMLVGEAPGGQEVREGQPFVGPAGRQLDRALEGLGVDRGDLYITNLVKVRPPENRNPHRAEIDAWWPVLEAEIERIDPDVIVPLGNFAARELLDVDDGITQIHGERFERDGRLVIPTFHPAATLYDESKLPMFREDLQAVLANG